jgi:hypothetical protein
MATRTSSLAPTNNTDANFRLWINEIHNSLIAFGWIQTADTGQINFSTVTRPAATNTFQGYAIYRPNDALQATCALFIRIDFGTGTGTDSPAIKFQITIGGTNGAGVLTGNASTQITLQGDVSSATLGNCRTAGSTSSFRMMMWMDVNITYRGFVLAIERDLDTSGNEVSLGVNWIGFQVSGGNTLTVSSQFIETAGGLGAVDNKLYAMISSQSSQSGGGNVGVAPVRTQLGPFRNPMKTLLLCSRSDFTMDTTNPVTIYGASHTYLMLQNLSVSISLNVWNTNTAFCFLWE